MTDEHRDIGREILDGLRELKREEHGRIVHLPDVASVREKVSLSKERFAKLRE